MAIDAKPGARFPRQDRDWLRPLFGRHPMACRSTVGIGLRRTCTVAMGDRVSFDFQSGLAIFHADRRYTLCEQSPRILAGHHDWCEHDGRVCSERDQRADRRPLRATIIERLLAHSCRHQRWWFGLDRIVRAHYSTSTRTTPQALSGSFRGRFPVNTNSAFASAGASGGVPGSPTPPGFSELGTMCTSIGGASLMRTTG